MDHATTQRTATFEQERPRLMRLAARILSDTHEAEDVVQNAWLRMNSVADDLDSVPAWLTTVTTRLCLDRLRARIPHPVADVEVTENASGIVPDAVEDLALAETVGVALQIMLDRLTPTERVAFVLHDSFGFDFPTIAEILGRTPVAVRKLASRARSKVVQPAVGAENAEPQANWQVVDAFLAAARNGDFSRLLELLAPNVVVEGDAAAITLGTPERIDGAEAVAQFFNGAAKAAFPVFIADRPGAAWINRGVTKVVFDFTLNGGLVQHIDFRADPEVIAQVQRREGQHHVIDGQRELPGKR